MKHISKLIILLLTAITLSGCLYKLDVQQGNEITPEMVDRLSIGMTKRQVERTLGLPLISDPFNKNRWDYFYSFKEGSSGKVQRQSASLFFEGDKLVDIQTNFKINADNVSEQEKRRQAEEEERIRQEMRLKETKEKNDPWWKFW